MKYNIILLDDDIYRAQQYIDKLNLFHFNAVATDSIKELLFQVRQNEFDAIILDINMLDKENVFKGKETWRLENRISIVT